MQIEKIQEITELFINNPTLLQRDVEDGFIFGVYAENEHYSVDEIQKIRDTVVSLLPTPEVVVTPVIEPPVEPQKSIEEIVKDLLIQKDLITPDPVEEVLP